MSFCVGEHIECLLEIRDNAGNLVDPDTSILVSVYRPDGTLDVDGTAMTKTVVGKYTYTYNSAGKPVGIYRARFKTVDATKITLLDSYLTLRSIA